MDKPKAVCIQSCQIPFLTSNCQGSPTDLLSLEKTQRVFVATKTSTFQAFLQRTGIWWKCSCFFSPEGSIPIGLSRIRQRWETPPSRILEDYPQQTRLPWKRLPSAATYRIMQRQTSYKLAVPFWFRRSDSPLGVA